jgi:hypothetical protein
MTLGLNECTVNAGKDQYEIDESAPDFYQRSVSNSRYPFLILTYGGADHLRGFGGGKRHNSNLT